MTSHADERANHRSDTPTEGDEASSSAGHDRAPEQHPEPEPTTTTAGRAEPTETDEKPLETDQREPWKSPRPAETLEVDLEEGATTKGEDVEKEKISLWAYHVDASGVALVFTLALIGIGVVLVLFPIHGAYYTSVVLFVLAFLRLWELSGVCAPRWPELEFDRDDKDLEQFEEEDAWHKGIIPAFWTGMMVFGLPAKVFGSLLIAEFLDWLLGGFRLWNSGEYLTPVGAVLLAILLEHFASYTQHVAGHKVTLFWRFFHQLHHAPSRYNVWLSLWHHPWELCAFGVKHYVISLLLAGLTYHELFWAVTIVNCQGWLVHANIRTPWLLGFIITRPESHVLHHEEPFPRPENFKRVNFSDCPLWDAMFCTFRNPRKDPREDPELKIGYPLRTNLWKEQMFGCLDIKEMRAEAYLKENPEYGKEFELKKCSSPRDVLSLDNNESAMVASPRNDKGLKPAKLETLRDSVSIQINDDEVSPR